MQTEGQRSSLREVCISGMSHGQYQGVKLVNTKRESWIAAVPQKSKCKQAPVQGKGSLIIVELINVSICLCRLIMCNEDYEFLLIII